MQASQGSLLAVYQQSVIHPPRFDGVVKAVENKNKGRLYQNRKFRYNLGVVKGWGNRNGYCGYRGYRISRMELIDLMSNIYQIQLLYLSFVLLIRQDLGKAVGRHFIYRNPMDVNLFVLDFLSKLVLIHVDILKLSIQFRYILSQQIDSLYIVAQQGKFAL